MPESGSAVSGTCQDRGGLLRRKCFDISRYDIPDDVLEGANARDIIGAFGVGRLTPNPLEQFRADVAGIYKYRNLRFIGVPSDLLET